jgi:NADPH:quinone reductase-like Zn-dependent oxidoreductase
MFNTSKLARNLSTRSFNPLKMHTAIVTSWGSNPKYVEIETPPVPSADSNLVQIKLHAAGLHHLVKSRAAGKHYTSTTLPHIPGSDGVGTTPDGKFVYFSSFATGGSYSEIVNVPKGATFPLPEGVDPIQAAALFNPAMSSWLALRFRTFALPEKFTILIMGATSASGSTAIDLARTLGAGKVIGVARNLKALEELELDERIQLRDPVESTDFSKVGDVDVVLDYLYGAPTVHLLTQLNSKVPVQYVNVGGVVAPNADLPSEILRSKDITMRGAGPGSWGMDQFIGEIPAILNALKDVKKRKLRIVKLAEIEKVWNEPGDRLVFVP